MYYREPCQHPKAPALGVFGRCRDRLVWASMHESSPFSQPTGRRKTASKLFFPVFTNTRTPKFICSILLPCNAPFFLVLQMPCTHTCRRNNCPTPPIQPNIYRLAREAICISWYRRGIFRTSETLEISNVEQSSMLERYKCRWHGRLPYLCWSSMPQLF